MTPQDIANISAEIEKLYESMTDELLLNIAAHLRTSTTTWTALHEIETLSNMGQLTEENVAIINEYVQMMPQAVKDAMNESRKEALAEIEGMLQKAATDGNLPYPVTDGTVAVVDAFSKQAADQLNLVNQTMLNSSLEAYQNSIYDYRTQMLKSAPRTIESAAELEAAQREIDLATGTVVTGQETRTKALRKALVNLNNRGITGFYDRAGRAWSGEAYVSMDIRTTVHNTYIQTIKTRQADYGSDVFQVSAHAGARPLCYPYQGKMYSWGDTGGMITLGDGKTYKYESIKATSYGQPAGLFGINCGHVPYPMIAGVSEPVNEKIQDKAENDKEYAESQKQRALERQIRSAKRQVEMLGDSATEDDKKIIRDAQASMREFIKQTGRTRRYDREQIVTAKGGNTGNAITRPVVTPTAPAKLKTVEIGDKMSASLGKDAKAYKDLVNKAPENVKVMYDNYAGTLNSVTQKNGGGKYMPSTKSITWDYADKDGRSRYDTISHEFGHHADYSIDTTKYSTKELNAVKDGLFFGKQLLQPTASTTDEFLTAMRKDKETLTGSYKKDATSRKTIRDDLLKNKNKTAGVQDAFDGFFNTSGSSNSDFVMYWGHGNTYYNNLYNKVVKGSDEEVKKALADAGITVKKNSEIKEMCRDYRTARELFANITAAETCGTDEIEYFKKYLPNSYAAWQEMTKGLINDA